MAKTTDIQVGSVARNGDGKVFVVEWIVHACTGSKCGIPLFSGHDLAGGYVSTYDAVKVADSREEYDP